MAFPTTLPHSRGRTVRLEPNYLYLELAKPPKPADLKKLLAEHRLVRVRDTLRRPLRLNETERVFWLRSHRPLDDERIGALRKQRGISAIGPVYRVPGTEGLHGLFCPSPERLLVSLAKKPSKRTDDALAKQLSGAGLRQRGKLDKLGRQRLVERTAKSKLSVYEAHRQLLALGGDLVEAVEFDAIPLLHPAAAVPLFDDRYPAQTNLHPGTGGIDAETAWDSGFSDPSVFVCVVDRGVELDHADLNRAEHRGYDLALGMVGSAPSGGPQNGDAHGTAMAGIAAANWDNGGVAGIAPASSLFSVPVNDGTTAIAESEVAAAVQLALDTPAGDLPGVASRIVLLAYSDASWGAAAFTAALDQAFDTDDVPVVAPTGNDLAGSGTTPGFPCGYRDVIGVGATEGSDFRVDSVVGTLLGFWSSNFGPGLTLCAPGLGIPTTDISGAAGYDPASDYYDAFEGTSAAAAHVAGVAALLRGQYPALTHAEVKRVLERTAERVNPGTYSYTDDLSTYPGGPYATELGYGRLSAQRAIDLADVYIKDDPADTGAEPSTGTFWRDSDFVVRKDASAVTLADVQANFDTWQPIASESRELDRTVDNYAYVRVYNLGPASATNVRVRAVAAACSTGFRYPRDWRASDTGVDSEHKVWIPEPWGVVGHSASGDEYVIADVPVGTPVYARFRLAQATVQEYFDKWGKHACALAVAKADNDYPFADFDTPLADADTISGQQPRRNNVIQRNLNVVPATSPWFFPFLSGNLAAPDEELELVIETDLPGGVVGRLALDEPERAFPRLDLAKLEDATGATMKRARAGGGRADCGPVRVRLLERTRVEVELGGARGLGVLEAGSRFEWLGDARSVRITGSEGRVLLDGERRALEIRRGKASVRLAKRAYSVLPLYLEIPVPPGARPTDRYRVDITERDGRGNVIGGISLELVP